MRSAVQAAGECVGMRGPSLPFSGLAEQSVTAEPFALWRGASWGAGMGNQERTDSWCAVSQDCSAKSSSSAHLFLFRSLLCKRNIWALHCHYQVRPLGGCLGAAAHLQRGRCHVSISIVQSRAQRERGDLCMPFLPPASLWLACHPPPCLCLSGGGSCLGFHSPSIGSGHPSHVGACGLFCWHTCSFHRFAQI